MAQSLARVLLHVVFSTKNRERWLDENLRDPLWAYMATVGREMGCDVFRVGGVIDHVHMAIDLGRTTTVAEFAKRVKQTSTLWLKKQSPQHAAFEWQRGYGAFSVGQSQMAQLMEYIGNQEEHHRKMDFKEEYLALLQKYGVKVDEQYLWD